MKDLSKIWRGTFEIWQNQEFSEIYARFSHQKAYSVGGFQVLASAKPFFGISTLYIYCLPDERQNLPAGLNFARRIGAARTRIYSIARIPSIEKFLKQESLTLIIDLRASQEELWARIGNKTRNMVRKSDNAGIIVKQARTETEFHEWWDIYCRVAVEKKFALQKKLLIAELFKRNDLGRLFISIKNGKVVGGSFFLVGKYPLYWLGGFDKKYSVGYANIWKATVTFLDEGYPLLDLGGINSDICDGPTIFKKHFSDRIERGFIYEVPANKIKSQILDFFTWIKRATKI